MSPLVLIEELKQKYDKYNINLIEHECDQNIFVSGQNRMNFILKLYYLERTKRFHENKVYKNATFTEYIYNKFNLRYTTYDKERFAFISFPDETIIWGAGLIDKIRKVCGADKVPVVINEMKLLKNVTHDQINKLISKHAKTSFKQKPARIPRKELEAENIQRSKTIAEYLNTIREKDEQILRLMRTVIALKEENKVLTIENKRLSEIISRMNTPNVMANISSSVAAPNIYKNP